MKKERWFTVLLIATLLLPSIVSLFIGAIDLKPSDLFSGNTEKIEIWFLSRLPRLLAAICTGIGMSAAGLIMQQLCSNKFLSPSTGAVISSSQFGILTAMIVFPNATLPERTIFAFAAAMVGTCLFVFFMQRIRFKDIIMVPLVGIMFGNIIDGITDYLSYKYGKYSVFRADRSQYGFNAERGQDTGEPVGYSPFWSGFRTGL